MLGVTMVVKTLYEGIIPYVLDASGSYVRSGEEAEKWMEHDRKFSEKELGAPPSPKQ